jgi:pimeloyl-ACP methyl ester carboxylesterase
MFKYFNHSKNLKVISIIVLLALVSGISPFNPFPTYALYESKLQNINVNPLPSSSSCKPSYSLLDPNPDLIDEHGNLINDINLAASLTTCRIGTIADSVSKLLLVIDSNNTLQFSIDGTTADNLTNGVLSSLDRQFSGDKPSSTVNVTSRSANNRSVVVAVYTPPDNVNLAEKISHRTVNILTNDTNNSPISIQLYRPPIVLVHGLWMNPDNTWVATNFNKTLVEHGFNPAFADYKEHNSKTFHPSAIKIMGGKALYGNYGIDSITNTINDKLREYHDNSIAASQVDVVGHSMGGLMARGFIQQSDYKEPDNFMKGSVHRLITIGTPHFGGPLSEILYEHRDDWYCFLDGKTRILRAEGCNEPNQLETSFEDSNTSVVQGGIKSLIPGSDAYSHLCQTPVSSYAIAGSWGPDATDSHSNQEGVYKTITENNTFNLEDKDILTDQNDLVVSVTSQLGGLPYHVRQPGSNDIPNYSSVYENTVHTSYYIIGNDKNKNVYSETNSPYIQEDVIKLLSSSDDSKFADAIGIGSPC